MDLYDRSGNKVGSFGGIRGPGFFRSVGIFVMACAALGLCYLIYKWTQSLTLLAIAGVSVFVGAYFLSKRETPDGKDDTFLRIAKVVGIVGVVVGGLYVLYLLLLSDLGG